MEETQESQGEVHSGESGRAGGPGCCGMFPSSLPGRAVPTWHSMGQVTSVKRKEIAAKAKDHPYL